MIRRKSRYIWRVVVDLTIFVSVLVMSNGANAQTNGSCPQDDSQIERLTRKALAQHGRAAEFNTLFVQGDKTAEITVHEPYEQASKYIFSVAFSPMVSTGKSGVSRALAVLGTDKIMKEDKILTRIIVSVPDAGWFWPRFVFFVFGCTADGNA